MMDQFRRGTLDVCFNLVLNLVIYGIFLFADAQETTVFPVTGSYGFSPGPPRNLKNVSSTENGIQIEWQPPETASNGGITDYKVAADLLFTYNTNRMVEKMDWRFPNNTLNQVVSGLLPGSEYNISVRAASQFGEGPAIFGSFWTEIGTPDNVRAAEIIDKGVSTITVKIQQVQLTTGPTSGYQVIVLDESTATKIDPVLLGNVSTALANHHPYYIAAELSQRDANRPFVVGDGATYRNYLNQPLTDDRPWTVIVGVFSSLNGITKASYSSPAVYNTVPDVVPETLSSGRNVIYPDVHQQISGRGPGDGDEDDDGHNVHVWRGDGAQQHSSPSALVVGLSVAIAIGTVLLLASVVVYILMRRYYGRQRRSLDHQELATRHSPASEIPENGIASSVLYINDDADLVDIYEGLKERFWHIPRSYLEMGDSVFGNGKFGCIRIGVAHRRNQQIPVLTQTSPCQASLLTSDWRHLLNELEAMLRLGSHTNLVTFVGVCEEQDVMHLATEHFQVSLKNFLLESRALDQYPVYAEKHNCFCTLKEEQLLELTVGISRGMAHLSQNKVVHGHLTAQNIFIADGSTPKIGHVGLSNYDSFTEKHDYTRWTAAESLKSKVYMLKSDVWSYGIVLWETLTIGATPYHGVRSKDIVLRVLRGMRLDQPKHIGDDLYQLMLQCWQIDLDERPSFTEITNILQGIIREGPISGHLQLSIYPGFQYDKYDRQLELVLSDVP